MGSFLDTVISQISGNSISQYEHGQNETAPSKSSAASRICWSTWRWIQCAHSSSLGYQALNVNLVPPKTVHVNRL